MKFSTIGSIFSIFVFCIPLKANAQVFNSETLTTARTCNTIVNMQDANPNNYQLRIGRRECNLRAYYVRLCTSSGYEYRSCWDNYYTRAIHVTTRQLIGIINNNQ
jgi:hypothetical protein